MSKQYPPVIAASGLLPALRARPADYWRLLGLLRQFEQAADEEERAAVSLKLRDLARGLPGGRDALRRAAQAVAAAGTRHKGDLSAMGNEAAPGQPPDTAAALEAALHPPTVTRYSDVYAPARVQTGRRFPIIVGLTRHPGDDEAGSTAIQAQLNQLIKVLLTPQGPAVELLDEPSKTIRVTEEGSERASFYLRATQNGTQSISIDLLAENTVLATFSHSFIAQTGPAAGDAKPLPPHPIQLAGLPPFPDLVLRVHTQPNRLTYVFHTPDTGERVVEVDKPFTDPKAYRRRLLYEIELLGRGKDANGKPLTAAPGEAVTPALIRQGLEKIGRRLYVELFNETMQREYHAFRANVKTLEIVSDEPWIPWELLKPYGPDFTDDFLCMQYDFSRWIDGAAAPGGQIEVTGLACIAPTDSGLDAAQAEKEAMGQLAEQLHLANHSPQEARLDVVKDLLAGPTPVQLWHFACHGDFDDDAPENSPLKLQFNRYLRPDDLLGEAEFQLRRERPLVFLNACRVGQLGMSLVGLGGWANTLIRQCGVGALVAPLWSVNDEAAQFFAAAFYRAAQGEDTTLGAAFCEARRQTRDAYPDDPTYLAYNLFAHPNAKLYFDGIEKA